MKQNLSNKELSPFTKVGSIKSKANPDLEIHHFGLSKMYVFLYRGLKQMENQMTVIGSDEQRALFGGSRVDENGVVWWTQSEMDEKIVNGTWGGGYVEGSEINGYVGEESTVDPNSGGDVSVIFDRSDGMIYIDVNGTVIDAYMAHNNTWLSSEGPWPNGEYAMMDTNSTHHHSGADLDTSNGAYGVHGIYRANNFCDSMGDGREGMGLHAGRADRDWGYGTNGCIRTTEAAMAALECYIGSYGSFTSIIVRD